MMKYNVSITYHINRGNFNQIPTIRLNFWHPYNEILDKCFLNDSESSIGSIGKIDNTLSKIEDVIQEKIDVHLIIGYDQDPVIECYKEKCKIVDSGPDEINSVPPNEIFGPNWNKRYPEKEWISTNELVQLLKSWKLVLEKYGHYVCVPRTAIKESFWNQDMDTE